MGALVCVEDLTEDLDYYRDSTFLIKTLKQMYEYMYDSDIV
jgi:hypothetical protein